MGKSKGLILIAAVVIIAILYTQGSFSSVATPEKITVVQGWNTVTIPDDWPGLTAATLIDTNPIVSAVAYYDGSHWTMNIRPQPTLNDFSITPGMELNIFATQNGTVNAPGSA